MLPTRALLITTLLALGGSVVVAALLPEPAMAQDPKAERLRLEEEMKKLAQRNAWQGVERKYDELLGLKIDLPFEDHQLGAQAARYLGKTSEMYERLSRAYKITESEEVFQEMSAIDSSFGRVDLKGSERFLPRIEPKVMPFAPDQRKSIEWANEVMMATGSFKGMLPAGEYKVVCQEFMVVTGPNPLIIPVEKPSKKEMEACLGDQPTASGEGSAPVGPVTKGAVAYVGPIASVGYNFMSNSAPADPVASVVDPALYQSQAQSVTGSGISLVVGGEMGFNGADKKFGVAAAVSYTGMYGGKTQYAKRPSTFNGGSAWVAATFRPGDLRVAVGPTMNLYYGEGTGTACWFELAPNEDWDPASSGNTEDACSRPSDPRYEPNNIEWRGVSLAPGAALSVGYGVLEFGSLQGVVELGASWASDGERQIINAGLRIGIVPALDRF